MKWSLLIELRQKMPARALNHSFAIEFFQTLI